MIPPSVVYLLASKRATLSERSSQDAPKASILSSGSIAMRPAPMHVWTMSLTALSVTTTSIMQV